MDESASSSSKAIATTVLCDFHFGKMRNFSVRACHLAAQTRAGVVRGRLNAHRRFRRGRLYAHGSLAPEGNGIFTSRCLCASGAANDVVRGN